MSVERLGFPRQNARYSCSRNIISGSVFSTGAEETGSSTVRAAADSVTTSGRDCKHEFWATLLVWVVEVDPGLVLSLRVLLPRCTGPVSQASLRPVNARRCRHHRCHHRHCSRQRAHTHCQPLPFPVGGLSQTCALDAPQAGMQR